MSAKMKVVLFVLALCVMLAACSKDESPEAEAPPTESPSELAERLAREAAETPAEIFWAYGNVTEEFFNQRFGDQVRQKFPHYTITQIRGTSQEQIVLGNPVIDLTVTSGAGLYPNIYAYNLETDISDLIRKYNFDVSSIIDGPMESLIQSAGGKITGFPWTIALPVFFYNKNIFDEFGVEYPTDNMTWDEAYELARRMTRTLDGKEYRGLTAVYGHALAYNQLGAHFFDPQTQQPQLTTDLFTRLFNNVMRFTDMLNSTPTDTRGVFHKDQTTAMHIDINGALSILMNAMNNVDIARYPQFPDRPGVGPSVNPDYVIMTSKSQSRDAAFQILAYIASEEYQSWSANNRAALPVLKDSSAIMQQFGQSIPGIEKINANAIVPEQFAPNQPVSPYFTIAIEELRTAELEYVAGKDTNTVLREAAERLNQRIQSMNQ